MKKEIKDKKTFKRIVDRINNITNQPIKDLKDITNFKVEIGTFGRIKIVEGEEITQQNAKDFKSNKQRNAKDFKSNKQRNAKDFESNKQRNAKDFESNEQQNAKDFESNKTIKRMNNPYHKRANMEMSAEEAKKLFGLTNNSSTPPSKSVDNNNTDEEIKNGSSTKEITPSESVVKDGTDKIIEENSKVLTESQKQGISELDQLKKSNLSLSGSVHY